MEPVLARAKTLINWVDVWAYFTGVWVYLILSTIAAPVILFFCFGVSVSFGNPQGGVSSTDLIQTGLATLGIMVVGSFVLAGRFLQFTRSKRKENPSWRAYKH